MKQQLTFTKPGQLSGPCVIMEPLVEAHREPLRVAAAEDPLIWKYFPRNFNGEGEDFDEWFDYTMERYRCDQHFPFAVRHRASNRIIGTTRLYDLVPDHLRVAIGSTWYTKEARGTHINPEVRLLTLMFVFETLGVNRVELITDPLNLNSRAAMRILGATQEGVIRNHMIYKDGRIRDSVLFSIIKNEWTATKTRLMTMLGYSNEMLTIT